MTEYIELRCTAPVELEDELAECAGSVPSRGCQISSEDGGRITIGVFFDELDAGRARRLGERLGLAGARDVTVRGISDRDWVACASRMTSAF